MTCRELAEFIADYLSGELDAVSRAQFDRHLACCPNCVRYLSDYQAAIALGRRAFADDDATVPEAVPDELVRAILAARKP